MLIIDCKIDNKRLLCYKNGVPIAFDQDKGKINLDCLLNAIKDSDLKINKSITALIGCEEIKNSAMISAFMSNNSNVDAYVSSYECCEIDANIEIEGSLMTFVKGVRMVNYGSKQSN